jgi:acetyltransferase-like isoleucine patch superfamily enzyme
MIVGSDVYISPSAEFRRPELIKIGNRVAIDSFFYCTTQLTIGDYVHVSPHVAVIGGKTTGLIVEDFCFMSVGSKYVCGSETFVGQGLVGPLIPDEYKEQQHLAAITLRRFSGALANSVILPGVTMAEGSVLGANSLLKEDTMPWTIYVGNPAKPIKTRDSYKSYEYAEKLGYHYDNKPI